MAAPGMIGQRDEPALAAWALYDGGPSSRTQTLLPILQSRDWNRSPPAVRRFRSSRRRRITGLIDRMWKRGNVLSLPVLTARSYSSLLRVAEDVQGLLPGQARVLLVKRPASITYSFPIFPGTS